MAPASSLADPVMLQKIDELFSCNIGTYIDLPQIVVIGDQSSGKSSVLESLTGLPFPKDSGLCTRFATQITFRRDAARSISVEIVPDKKCDKEHAEKVKSWKKHIQTLDQSTFEEIMCEVNLQMGLSKDPDAKLNGHQKIFTEDILRIHVAGPDQEHFSVIDVPGVFKNPQPPVTENDMKMVERMVLSYMANSRSVLLAVIPANVDIATQSILQYAKSADKDGQRTLGVLTKPDLVDKGAESSVIDLLEGRKHKLNLGWSIVRNPGQAQAGVSSDDRKNLEEEFFALKEPWNKLSSDKVGVSVLRTRLQEILNKHIRCEFPQVKAELQKRLKDCHAELDILGPKRSTPEEQRALLIDMATRFQSIGQAAVNATYNGDEVFEKYPNLRIATIVRNRNDVLAKDFTEYGHTYSFSLDDNQSNGVKIPDSPQSNRDEDMFMYTPPSEEPQPEQQTSKSICVRKMIPPEELEGMLYEQHELQKPKREEIVEWMKGIYKSSRGFELGTFNPSVLATTMKAQSANWTPLARGYVSDIIVATHDFVKTLLKVVCPDARLQSNILATIADQLAKSYEKALLQVDFILEVERSGVLQTGNHYFNDNLDKRRSDRMRIAIEDKAFSISPQRFSNSNYASIGRVVRLDDLGKSHPMSNTDHIVQDLQDILAAYYKVALKRIIDNISMQAVAFHLVSGPDTSLKLFSPAWVGRLSPEELEEIAGEEPSHKRRRAQLQKEIDDLEKGKRILSKMTS